MPPKRAAAKDATAALPSGHAYADGGDPVEAGSSSPAAPAAKRPKAAKAAKAAEAPKEQAEKKPKGKVRLRSGWGPHRQPQSLAAGRSPLFPPSIGTRQAKDNLVGVTAGASPHAGPAPPFAEGLHERASLESFTASIAPRSPGTIKIVSYNANGLRAVLGDDKPGGRLEVVRAWLQREQPDVLLVQETKMQPPPKGSKDEDRVRAFFSGLGLPHAAFVHSTAKLGYSGVAAFARSPFLSVRAGVAEPEADAEGRVLTIELDACFLVNAYVPNSGVEDLARLEYRSSVFDPKLRELIEALETGGASASSLSSSSSSSVPSSALPGRGKPVVLCGDLNVAFHDLDVHAPSKNRNKTAGFCDAERDGFAKLLASGGGRLRDVYRERNPTLQQFSYWSSRFDCRGKNKGWRLDYLLISHALADKVIEIDTRATFPVGADHVPIVAVVKL